MLRTLLISSDPQLVFHIEPALRKLEFEMDLKPSIDAGMDKMRYERYHAIVVDCAAGSLQLVEQSREQWLKRDPVVIAVAGQDGQTSGTIRGADAVWNQPLVSWEVYRTLLGVRTRATGDRRLRKRFVPHGACPLRYTFGSEQYQARIVDITETGVAIECTQAPPEHVEIQIEFKLPAMLSPIRTLADVVWRNEKRAGLHFSAMPQQQHRQLERWLQHSRQGMSTGYSYAAGF